jgi:hypothetical protein
MDSTSSLVVLVYVQCNIDVCVCALMKFIVINIISCKFVTLWIYETISVYNIPLKMCLCRKRNNDSKNNIISPRSVSAAVHTIVVYVRTILLLLYIYIVLYLQY